MKPLNHLLGAVCDHYFETDGQLCKRKKSLPADIDFPKQLSEQLSKKKKETKLILSKRTVNS